MRLFFVKKDPFQSAIIRFICVSKIDFSYRRNDTKKTTSLSTDGSVLYAYVIFLLTTTHAITTI